LVPLYQITRRLIPEDSSFCIKLRIVLKEEATKLQNVTPVIFTCTLQRSSGKILARETLRLNVKFEALTPVTEGLGVTSQKIALYDLIFSLALSVCETASVV
jgi:hypothetical protein